MRRIAKLAALAAAVLALAAAGAVSASAATATPSPGPSATTYRIGIGQDYDGMNPFVSWSGISWESFRLGYDFLTWYDADYEPVPDVATSWETSADGKTWTFHIREGMQWHDGRPLTARDVAFTYNLILDTQHWAYIQYLTGVTSVTAPDDATVVITTRRPSAGMLALYIPILPEHIWKKVDPDRLETFRNMPFVGSGPFRVAELEKSKWVKLEANPAYPADLGGAPTVTEVYFVISQNTDSMLEDYKAGSLDAVVDFPATYEKVLATVPGTDDGRRTRRRLPRAGVQLLGELPRARATRSCATRRSARRSTGPSTRRRSSRRRWPAWPHPRRRSSRPPRATGTGRCRRPASIATTLFAPSRSSRTPGTPTVTRTASARTPPATS